MKLKINKPSDLSSISVLPPQARKLSAVHGGAESSVFGRSQSSQPRSQPSQQSFSQGVSSQHALFSQISQNSMDETLTNDQRFGSQEREAPAKWISSLLPINHAREESQIQMPKSSTNLLRNWDSASVPDNRCQRSEELHRIGMMETSLNKLGMVLGSLQSDIMQLTKGTKDVVFEMESIRQKLVSHDNLLQLANKGHEEIQANLDGCFKTMSDQLDQNAFQRSLQEISSLLSALPEKIEGCMLKLRNDLHKNLVKELQAFAASLKNQNQKSLTPSSLEPKGIGCQAATWKMPSLENLDVHTKVQQATLIPKKETGSWDPGKHKHPILPGRGSKMGCKQSNVFCPSSLESHMKVKQAILIPKKETGSWNPGKHEQSIFTGRGFEKGCKQNGVSPTNLERESRVIIESDEEIDELFSCLLRDREAGSYDDTPKYSIEDAEEETRRILWKARRKRRKCRNVILIN